MDFIKSVEDWIQSGDQNLVCLNANLAAELKQNEVLRRFYSSVDTAVWLDGKLISRILRRSSYHLRGFDVLSELFDKIDNDQFVFIGSRRQHIVLKDEFESATFIEVPFFNSIDELDFSLFDSLNHLASKYIIISLSAPKQELLIEGLHGKYTHHRFVALGAAVDYYIEPSGQYAILSMFYLEWLGRLISSPKKTFKRLKREIPLGLRLICHSSYRKNLW